MKSLFDNTEIKGMRLKNRFIRSATWLRRAHCDGHISDDVLHFYEELAKGGAGLILTGYAFVSQGEQPNPRMLGAYDDRFIKGFEKLADIVHCHGSLIALQIAYGGSQCTHPDAKSMDIIGASAVYNAYTDVTPREATKKDIQTLVEDFGQAAVRAQKAGMDGVQVHAAHGYLLSQWLTPYFNRRTDEYGGSIHNRARIIYEICEEIRARVGNDFPLMIKMNYSDLVRGSQYLTMEEAMKVFVRLDEMEVDLIEVSGGNTSLIGSFDRSARKDIADREKQSYFRAAAAQAASRVKHAKVALVGGNRKPKLMTEILNETEIEYFSLSRPFLCEPDIVNKWKSDTEYEMKCRACNQCWGKERNECIFTRK